MTQQSTTRVERKERTRQALLDSALALSTDRGFAALSLREVARSAGVVPTAFYRHFSSLDDLGMALLDAGIAASRLALRDARRNTEASLSDTVGFVFTRVDAQRALYSFLVSERHGGSAPVRTAIAQEIEAITREVVADLSRIKALDTLTPQKLEIAADLMVGTVAHGIAAYVSAVPNEEDAIVARTAQQVRLILVGLACWRPAGRE
ncbi:TetR family transcriptional regulator [Nocardia sp. CNY236]|uniref:TetR family transcriptional regulator n=1 Tax=Nocardia sp. CNY236 TaxID=1169152 RepID=UPI00056AEB5A|nr:TetR family transcriptional regulator [Nocardia sp. CNY236]